MNEYMVQAIGFLGVALFIVSYQIRSNRALFLCQLVGCIVFCVQFFLMGAYTGAISLIVNIARNLLLIKSNDWKWAKSQVTLAAIIVLLLVMTICTWAGWISILPFVSVAVTSIGYWTQNAQKIRLSQLFGSPCTLLYDILVHTWGGAVCEAITILSIIISIVRFGWRNLGEESGVA
ncbi:YgjV family protein [uncultured Oscillibacter sp.]|uniref:YgjV family protein n=1 Tax=uncultured Oscillibacter sp. TaxID=876091 RepID=UPI0026308188|nr:YgjV family protein [uncultured Oscillibacter sp.]